MLTSSAAIEAAENDSARRVVIPYIPRKHFLGLHQCTKRFKFLVAHRRAGKSVAMINEMIKAAMLNPREFPRPRYGYVGPSFAQTKDLIWGYLKHYAGSIPDTTFSESDLTATLPNGATITLYGGAAAYERMRGVYFDGIVLDEFPLLNPAVFSTVVRPCLADYRGWAIVSGTSNGDDHFHELKKRAEKEPDTWEVFVIPVTETDALHPDEVAEMTKDMSDAEYAREMLCRFDAPIEGAYYADLMNNLESNNHICGVPYEPAAVVFTWWDLGIDDATAIWFFQRVGRELHLIRYEEFTGMGLTDSDHGKMGIASTIKSYGYTFGGHIMPHDIKARELGTGRSRYELATELFNEPIFITPMHKVEDGIAATRSVIPMCYFDKDKCAAGISALRNYQRGKKGTPVHNWASHGADAFRTGSIGLNQVMGFMGSSNVTHIGAGRLRRRIRGIQ